jgi:hypothetical protein
MVFKASSSAARTRGVGIRRSHFWTSLQRRSKPLAVELAGVCVIDHQDSLRLANLALRNWPRLLRLAVQA